MARSVYLETSIISYLAAWPSRDLVTAARQELTRQWWARRRGAFDVYVSEAVVAEARAGDPEVAARSGRFGLTTMAERARAVGGALDVRSALGEGTTVALSVPVHTVEA